jgi:hypothetical protein
VLLSMKADQIWRHASPLKGHQTSRSIRAPSPIWRTIYRRRGMRRVLRCVPASNCCGR